MRLRLIAAIVGVVALVLLVHDVPLAGHLERVERDRLVTKLERDAFILAGRSEEGLEARAVIDDPVLQRLVQDYSAAEDVRVVVVDADGVGVLGSEGARTVGADFTNRPEILRALEGVSNSGERASETLGEELFFVAVPVLSGEEVRGAVRLSAPERVVGERASERVGQLFVVALISLAIAFVVAWLTASMIARPLARLRTATNGLAGGDLSTRARVDEGPPELQDLGSAFNAMADRLEHLVERQRAFAGTASHQLRTPLTALRLRLEQLEVDVADDPAAAHHLEEAIAECDRLHRMIEGLLALTRAEERQVEPETIDVGTVVVERAEQWQALAEEQGATLKLRIRSDRRVWALPGAVEQIVDNLVDNALEASGRNGTLTLVVADEIGVAGQDRVVLHVVDDGPGLNAEDRSRAFVRFWRSPDAGTGGSGLGLSIVAQLAEAGGGTARLEASSSGGIDATVEFVPAR